MGLDINNQGPGQQNLNVNINLGSSQTSQNTSNTSSTTNTSSTSTTSNTTSLLSTDNIVSSRSDQGSSASQSSSTLSSSPTLSNPTGTLSTTVSSQISDTIKNYNLPEGRDLSDRLSDDTKAKILQLINELDDGGALDFEMKNFFNLLSKLYPLSLSLLEALLGGKEEKSPDEIAKQALNVLKELGNALGEYIDQLDVPKEMKDQLKNLASQLMSLGNVNCDPQKLKEELETLLKSLGTLTANSEVDGQADDLAKALAELAETADGNEASLKDSPELLQKLSALGLLSNKALANQLIGKDELDSLISQLQKGAQGDLAKLLQSLSASLGMLGTLKGLPQADKSLGLSAFLAMQNIDSKENSSGLLGPKLGEFSASAAKFILAIQEKEGALSGTLPRGAEGQKFYSSAFSQIMLSAAVLGRMIAHSKPGEMSEDAIKVAVLKLNSAKDLGIVDQIPFSFMAFFADLSNRGDDFSDAVKEARQSLLQLIRLLLKLIFILMAIASAGTKLGEKGMNALLEENAQFITGILDALVFALKKVDESYVVNVKFHSALLQKGKDSLAAKDFSEFWVSMLHMFNEKTELVQFLKDMEDAKPLFTTLESMMSDSKEALPINFPIAT